MWRFVLVSFVFLGWSFYELSGGADYRPAPGSLQVRAGRDAPVPAPAPKTDPKTAPRAAGVVLASAEPEPEPEARRHAVRPLEVVVRLGPGEGYGRVARLERHDEVELLRAPGGGWVRVRVAETGQAGWMPEGLLYRVP
jgi:hypothetical protein